MNTTTQELINQNQVIVCWNKLNEKLAPVIGGLLDYPTKIDSNLINDYMNLIMKWIWL